ncbi:MAG TPA: PAS domain-containing protein [Chitinophagales bacterium]|nr:PAS domain-containing protein [Chitinophagales bacterium]
MKKNKDAYAGGITLQFNYLPAYSQFLLDNKLEEFALAQLRIGREIQVPLLNYFKTMPEAELKEMAIRSTKEMLGLFSENKVKEYIDKSLQSWITKFLPFLQRDEIVIQDISIVSFVRRKVFRDFLPQYSSDIEVCTNVMEEVDLFAMESERVCYQALFDLQKKKINEDHYLIDKINNTTPGILYLFDVEKQKEIYSNHKREVLLGYSDEDMKEMEGQLLVKLVHPDDLPELLEYVTAFSMISDDETRTIEYRVKNKQGIYRWHRSYETVFKRNDAGIPSEIIGIAIDITDDREIALRLKSSEQQLIEAQELAGLGHFEWNLGVYESVYSPQLKKILELDSKTTLTTFLEYVHPSDRSRVKASIDEALIAGGDYECEYRYRKNGSEKVIWARGLVTLKDGKPLKMQGTVMDVTQRHHMLQRLERSEELHNQAQAITHIGNWSWFIGEVKVNWSDELYRIYGLEPQSEVITFERFLSFVHPEDRDKRRQQIQQAIDTHIAEDYVMRIVVKEGLIKVLHGKGQVMLDENDKPYKLVGTCQDVTKEEQLIGQLKENEETFRQLIYNAPDAVVVIDEHSMILLWNPKAEEIFGWKADEAIGKSLLETIIPQRYGRVHLDGLHRLHTTGKSRVLNKTLEIMALNKSGQEFYIALTIARSRRADIPVFVFFIRDISNEKKAEMELEENRNRLAQLNQSLEQKNQELERSNQELMSFNYIASHDLQEPLRKIKMFTNRIMDMSPSYMPDGIKDSFNRIINSAERMQTLIDDLLSFSRTSSGEKVFESVDLNGMLDEVQNSLKHSLEEKNGKIISSPLPALRVIRFQFQQLLENIISNAIKYSKKDLAPQIKITSALVKGNQIVNENAKPDKNYCRIRIADNGIGFDQQHAKRIFELFQRLHGKSEYSGTGIGLAICKKIVDNHNGFITAEGRAGAGAVFNIFIPA